MKKFLSWLYKDFFLQIKVGLTNFKTALLLLPIFLLTLLVVFVYFRGSLAEHGFWVIFTPLFISLFFAIAYQYPKRNNPNYLIYYIFHPTLLVKISVIMGLLFFVWLYFYAQCREYGLGISVDCLSIVFSSR